eukprot:303936-Amphidinium_carterae.1
MATSSTEWQSAANIPYRDVKNLAPAELPQMTIIGKESKSSQFLSVMGSGSKKLSSIAQFKDEKPSSLFALFVLCSERKATAVDGKKNQIVGDKIVQYGLDSPTLWRVAQLEAAVKAITSDSADKEKVATIEWHRPC